MKWLDLAIRKPKQGQSVLFANWRGVGYCHSYDENGCEELRYAWKEATHWCPAKLPKNPDDLNKLFKELPKEKLWEKYHELKSKQRSSEESSSS